MLVGEWLLNVRAARMKRRELEANCVLAKRIATLATRAVTQVTPSSARGG